MMIPPTRRIDLVRVLQEIRAAATTAGAYLLGALTALAVAFVIAAAVGDDLSRDLWWLLVAGVVALVTLPVAVLQETGGRERSVPAATFMQEAGAGTGGDIPEGA